MARLTALVFLFCLLLAPVRAQNEIDSLNSVLGHSGKDTVRVNAYLQFFFTDLFYDAPREVIDYSHKALHLSREIAYPKGEVKAHNNLGYIYRTRSENDSALHHYGRAVEKAGEIGFYKGLTDAYIGLGNTYNQQSEWQEAIAQFEQVISLAREAGDSIQIGSAHNNIGNTYLSQSRYEEALENYQISAQKGDAAIRGVALINSAVVHNQMGNLDLARESFQRSLDQARELNKRNHLAFIYRNLGILEKQDGNFDRALGYYSDALDHYQGLSDDYSSAEILQNMGNVYFETAQYEKALQHYRQSLEMQVQITNPTGACYNRLFIAKTYLELGANDRSREALERAAACADSMDLLSIRADASQLMSQLLEAEGNYREALAYHQAFKMWSDSLKSINSEEKIAEMNTRYQTAQKEQEILLLSSANEVANLQIEKQNNTRNFLIIAALILGTLALTLYSRATIKTRANRKLQELDSMKTRFFTNISHEFRTPLTLLLNPLDKLLESGVEKESMEHVRLARRNAVRLLELTDQMLDLSKLEAGKLRLQVREANLQEFLDVVSASFYSLAGSRGIEFVTDFELTVKTCFFDADKLQKVLNNLLSNAFKFTPSDGRVTFEGREVNGQLSLSVRDSGPGIEQGEREMIFERFQQGTQGQTIGGTGVGLTLTKELVLLHHGDIKVDENPGGGSSFHVSIPVSRDAYSNYEMADGSATQLQEAVEPAKKETAGRRAADDNFQVDGKGPIVLVVEDHPELLKYMRELLHTEYRVITAKDGRDGLEQARKSIPDLIISDWMMPEMDGGQLCESVKKDEKTSHIPVILLTAKADKESRIDGLAIGADAYLGKPFDNRELLVRVRNLIGQRRALRHKFAELVLLEPSKIELSDPDRDFLERAMGVVDNHLDNSQFTVVQFQMELGMSRTQLHRKLKGLVDQSASEFIRNIRLQRAADLLSRGKLQVSEVAYQCGFNNLSYFGQCFKEKFGMAPSRFAS